MIIELEVSYQFKAKYIIGIKNSNKTFKKKLNLSGKYMHQLIQQFKDFDGYKRILQASGKSAVHDSCANFSTTEFQTDRGLILNYCEIFSFKI